MPHRSAPVRRKSVAVEIDDVDVDGPQRVSLFENPSSLIYQRVNAAIDDLFGGNLPLRHSCLRAPFPHQRMHLGVRTRAPTLVVAVPPLHRFLSVAPHFTKAVLGERLGGPPVFLEEI